MKILCWLGIHKWGDLASTHSRGTKLSGNVNDVLSGKIGGSFE